MSEHEKLIEEAQWRFTRRAAAAEIRGDHNKAVVGLWSDHALGAALASALTVEQAARVAAERERDASDAALINFGDATAGTSVVPIKITVTSSDALDAARARVRARKHQEPGNG